MNEITLPQGTIRYRDEGTGPVLLFVHGLLVAGDVWGSVVSELKSKYRCITPDWPLGSHGVAMNDDADLTPDGVAKIVAAFMKALDLRDVTVVGNDSGGAITQLLLARHDGDERVTRAVLTPCDAFEVFPPKLFWYLGALSFVPGALWLLGKMLHAMPILGRLPIAYGLVKTRPIPSDNVARWIAPVANDARIRRDLVKFIRAVHPRVTLKVAKELPRVTVPVLIVWAPEDRWFPFSLAERLADTLPNAEIVTIRDSFIFVMFEQPRALADEMKSFLRRTERQREDVRVSERA